MIKRLVVLIILQTLIIVPVPLQAAEHASVQDNVKSIISGAFEGNYWLLLEGKPLREHLCSYFTNEKGEEIFRDINIFKEENSDWHLTTKVKDVCIIDLNTCNITVKVHLTFLGVCFEGRPHYKPINREKITVSVTKTVRGWRIKDYSKAVSNKD